MKKGEDIEKREVLFMTPTTSILDSNYSFMHVAISPFVPSMNVQHYRYSFVTASIMISKIKHVNTIPSLITLYCYGYNSELLISVYLDQLALFLMRMTYCRQKMPRDVKKIWRKQRKLLLIKINLCPRLSRF